MEDDTVKRLLLAVLLCLSAPVSAWANACVAQADGKWATTTTWTSCGGVAPTAADTVDIGAFQITCDTGTCLGFDLDFTTTGGNLRVLDGATLKFGGGTSTTGEAMVDDIAGNHIILDPGSTMEFNCSRNDMSTSECTFTIAAGFTAAKETVVESLVVTSVGAVSWSGGTTTQQLTFANLGAPATDYYATATSRMYAKVRSGWFQSATIPITANGVNTLTLGMGARGLLDTRNKDGATRLDPTAWLYGDRGQTYSHATCTLTNGATTFTCTGTPPWNNCQGNVLPGAKVICASDVSTADDADFATICTSASGTSATLCSNYTGVGCAGAAVRVYDYNEPAYAVPIIEDFIAGDIIDIIKPVLITATNKSDVNMNGQYSIIVANGASAVFDGTILEYCGIQTSGSDGPDCLRISNIDNTSSTEGVVLKDMDIFHYSGEDAIELVSCNGITIEGTRISNAAEGYSGCGGSHEAHGIRIEGGSSTANMIIRNNLIDRTNDGMIAISGASELQGTGLRIYGNRLRFTPANDGGSCQGIVLNDAQVDAVVTGNLVADTELAISVDSADITLSQDLTVGITKNLILNSVGGGIVAGGVASTDLPDSENKVYVGANVLLGVNSSNLQRGYQVGNFLAPLGPLSTVGGNFPMSQWPQSARGNIFIGPPNANASIALISAESVADNTASLFPATVVMADNVIVQNATGSGAQEMARFDFYALTGSAPYRPVLQIDHNFSLCNDSLSAASVDGFQMNTDTTTTDVARSNIFVDCNIGPYVAIGPENGGVITESYNLCLQVVAANCKHANITAGGNTLQSGFIAPPDMRDGNVSALKGTTPWSSLGHDGTVRGPRVAGPPDFSWVRTLYPFSLSQDTRGQSIPPLTNTNSIGDSDTDGDGYWDTFDNCDGVWNPTQHDEDEDGKGDACDR